MRLLFDTNVLLDVLLVREPHVREAAALLEHVETNRLVGLIAATTVTTLSYFLERAYGPAQAQKDIRDVLRLFEVAPVGRAVLEEALQAGFSDYEDAVLHEAARQAAAHCIVTRNASDFSAATLPIYTPTEFLQTFEAGSAGDG